MSYRKTLNAYLLCFSALSFLSLPNFVNAKPSVDKMEKDVKKSLTRYVDTKEQRTLNPDSSVEDAKDLASSVEFEVYVMNEDFSSRSVFVSGAGVCKGFDGDYGVDFANSTNNYVNRGDESQYYGGITGASLYREGEPKNVQYVPVYVINNPQLEKEIRERENKHTKDIVKDKVSTSKQLLDKMVCKPSKGKK